MTKSKTITTTKQRKINKMDIIFTVAILIAFIFSLWRCRYGFGGNDEGFYLTIPHRITLGDIFIQDEWHLSQLSGFLTLPIVSLYTLIMGTTTGIILFMRYIYVVAHLLVSVFVYIRLRKYGYGTLVAVLLYFIFTPFDIMTLSYNTMGLDLVTLSGVLMATADYNKKVSLIVAGIVFAGGVLCNPYLVIAYIIYALIAISNAIIKKLGKTIKTLNEDYFSLKTFLVFSCGVLSLTVVFFIVYFSRAGISDIQTNLSYMLADPEHPPIAILDKIKYYFQSVWNCSELFKFAILAYGFLLAIMTLVDNNRKTHRIVYLVFTSAIVIFGYCTFIKDLVDMNFNNIMFPAVFLGITSYILSENKNKKLFVFNFCFGFVYSFAMCFASNQYYHVQSMAMASVNISSFVFAGVLIKEILDTQKNTTEEKQDINKVSHNKKIRTILVFVPIIAVVAFQGVLQVVVKVNHIFWEYPLSQLNTTLTDGPAKGIITNNIYATSYQNILSDINEISENNSGEKILFLTEKTWTYLASEDMEYSTFSAWISGENDTSLSRLKQYYQLNPEKVPTYIYIPKESYWNIISIQNEAVGYGYDFKEMSYGYLIEKI